jgi:excisionase family DNA binding protein
VDSGREDKVSEEKLLNINEVAEYLGLSPEGVRKLVNKGEIPAYQIGGVFLRFKKSQIEEVIKKGFSTCQPSLTSSEPFLAQDSSEDYSFCEKLKDFLYFNDFYIISIIIILIILIVIFM